MRTMIGTLVVLAITATSNHGAEPPAFAVVASPSNAATLYQQAADALPEFLSEDKELLNSAARDGLHELTSEQRARISDLLAKSEPALTLLLKGSRHAGCRWEIDFSQGPRTHLPHLRWAIDLSRIATLRMEALIEEGRLGEAMELLQATLQLAGQLSAPPPILLSALTRYAIEERTINTVARNLSSLDSDRLKQLTAIINAIHPYPSTPQIVRTEQRLAMEWLTEALAKAEGSDDPRANIQRVAEAHIVINPTREPFTFKAELPLENSRKLLSQYQADFAKLATIAEKPAPENALEFNVFLRTIHDRNEALLVPGSMLSDSLLSRAALPVFSGAFGREQKARLYIAALRTGIALREKDGGFPSEATDATTGNVFLCRSTAEGFELEPKEPVLQHERPMQIRLLFR